MENASFLTNSPNTKINKINATITDLELTILEQSANSLKSNQSNKVKLNNVKKLQSIINKLIGLREKLTDINKRDDELTKKIKSRAASKSTASKSRPRKGGTKKIKHKRKKRI